jgi:HAD superfamily hydrolase (TIGR01509 family)
METKIKGIVFDFFGVLSSGVGGPWFNANIPSLTEAEYRKQFLDPWDLGTTSVPETWRVLGEITGKSPNQVEKEWVSFAHIDTRMIERYMELEKHYKVGVCTNVGGPFFREVLKVNSLENTFSTLVVSSEVGLVKPQPEIYALMLKKLELQANEVVFIDDTLSNVTAANALHMHGIHFTSLERMNEELEKLGVS